VKVIKRVDPNLTAEEILKTADDVQTTVVGRVQEWLAPVGWGTTQFVGRFLVGLIVMIFSLYYFLADGPVMIHALMRLLPLDQRYTQQLVEQFANVTRAVVVATLLSAIIQGLFAGVGFYVVGGFKSIFLLTVLATLLAMVPFIGPPLVWAPACLWLFFYEQRATAAILLAIYGTAVVSTVDNIVKPLVLHGRSNLHPLLALLSVLGGVQALGLIGIFVGPMVVAFLQTLLNLLHDELTAMQSGQPAAAVKPAGQTLGTS
jgi:predicted PurR-regulated permease PerM